MSFFFAFFSECSSVAERVVWDHEVEISKFSILTNAPMEEMGDSVGLKSTALNGVQVRDLLGAPCYNSPKEETLISKIS